MTPEAQFAAIWTGTKHAAESARAMWASALASPSARIIQTHVQPARLWAPGAGTIPAQSVLQARSTL
jgi:hypothetical protein